MYMPSSFKKVTIDNLKYYENPLTLKFEAKPKTHIQYTLLIKTAKLFTKALVYTSKFYASHLVLYDYFLKLNNRFPKKGQYPYMSKLWLHHWLYYLLRNKFDLKSQEACDVIKRVYDSYRATYLSLKYKPKKWFCDNGVWIRRQPTLLDVIPLFKHPQLQLVAENKKEWTFRGKPKHNNIHIALTTIKNRLTYKVNNIYYFDKYLKTKHKWGTINVLLHIGKHNHLHVWFHMNIKIYKPIRKFVSSIGGGDRGQNNIYYYYNNFGKSKYISGLTMKHRLAHQLHQHSILQRKNTRQTRRKSKELTRRDKSRNANTYQVLSKTLALATGSSSYLAYENLITIRKALVRGSKKRKRYSRVSWGYSKLAKDTLYKLGLMVSDIIHVNPRLTSTMCPRCHMICWSGRDRSKHCFKCKYCGFYANDDRVGALNIYQLAKAKIEYGVHYPTIRYDKYNRGYICEGSQHYKRYKKDLKRIKAINQH